MCRFTCHSSPYLLAFPHAIFRHLVISQWFVDPTAQRANTYGHTRHSTCVLHSGLVRAPLKASFTPGLLVGRPTLNRDQLLQRSRSDCAFCPQFAAHQSVPKLSFGVSRPRSGCFLFVSPGTCIYSPSGDHNIQVFPHTHLTLDDPRRPPSSMDHSIPPQRPGQRRSHRGSSVVRPMFIFIAS